MALHLTLDGSEFRRDLRDALVSGTLVYMGASNSTWHYFWSGVNKCG